MKTIFTFACIRFHQLNSLKWEVGEMVMEDVIVHAMPLFSASQVDKFLKQLFFQEILAFNLEFYIWYILNFIIPGQF